MKRIGIAGGMGSGKSTICDVWRDMGAFVVDSDNLAKEILAHSSDVKVDVIRIFGKDAYLENGKLNRAFLAQQAFSEGKLDELTRILHPAVFKRIAQIDAFAEEEGVQVLVREAAILLNHGRPEELDTVILVIAPLEERIRRVIARDGCSREDAMARIQRQKSDEDLMPLCDIVIENTGDIDALRARAKELYDSWVA
jgi:dephospho-CoA kinase